MVKSTKATRGIHWTAYIGATLSFGFLFWLLVTLVLAMSYRDEHLIEKHQNSMTETALATVTMVQEETHDYGDEVEVHFGWRYSYDFSSKRGHHYGHSVSLESKLYEVGQQVEVNYDPKYPRVSQLKNTSNYTITTMSSTTYLYTGLFTSVVLLWMGYRSKIRISIMRHATFLTARASIGSGSHSSNSYVFTLEKKRHYKMIFNTFRVKHNDPIKIVYNRLKPSQSYRIGGIKARYDEKTSLWRSSLFHVIPRLLILLSILFVFMVIGSN